MSNPQRSLRLTQYHSDFLSQGVQAPGEIFYDQDLGTLRIFDGNVTGGVILSTSPLVDTAISLAIGTEVINRNSAIGTAIGTEVINRNSAIGTAIGTEVINRNSAIGTAIGTEVINRNSAIGTAVNAKSSTAVSPTPPLNPKLGDIWLNSNTGKEYIYNTAQWVQPVSPAFGTSGSGSNYILPIATNSVLGGVKVDGSTITISNGVISSTAGNSYTLPTASTSVTGGIKIDGTTLAFNGSGQLYYTGGGVGGYTLPTASTGSLGGVKIDGTSIVISNQVISSGPSVVTLTASQVLTNKIIPFYYADQTSFPNASSYHGAIAHSHADDRMYFAHSGAWQAMANVADITTYSLPTATTTVLGGVKVDGSTITITNGVISGVSSYSLPTASTSVTGGIKIDGTTLAFNGSGQLYYTGAGVGGYTLPTATTSTLGGVKIDGTTITISNGVISSTSSGSGTVTTLSVVSTNGFAGTVATATSTPAITISTSITGLLKGNGAAISAASAGSDYQAPITLTTNGSSGAATFSGGTLNIPQYAGSNAISWSISSSGSADYIFSGPGIVSGNTNDPVLYLYKGFTYEFVNTTGGSHPFAIRVSNGGAAYTSGVSGSQTGTQTFTVPMNAPATLYYQCTIHSTMGNVINIV